jgi:hypothetical protein
MTLSSQTAVPPARPVHRRPVWYFIAVSIGILLEIFAIYIFEFLIWLRYLLLPLRLWEISAILPLLLRVLRWSGRTRAN